MSPSVSELTITTPAGETFGAYAAFPAATGPAPGLLLLNEVFGVNRFMRALAEYWAGRGFLAVCPKLYWRIDPAFELDPETPGHRDQALATRTQFDVDLAVSDTAAAVAHLKAMPGCNGKVATQGYCLGGLLAFLHAARGGADCDISYYGVGIEDYLDEAAQIKRPVMLHIGEADPWTPAPVREATADALAGHAGAEIYTYADTGHAFAREGASTEVKAVKILANGRSEAMLNRVLR
ncbi:MAG: dienelactone hydrolase family protein [Alphaproteobacteria bacterium]|nr:dienelactone hydrolase family protein [Alphaproteobacteria bacterium]